jgi:serine phosphatase RsbU (regulator of sigma subunit)
VIEVAGVGRPKPGEQVSGDGWLYTWLQDGTAVIAILDGLGHGPGAARAASVALASFEASLQASAGVPDPVDLLLAAHLALRPTRGAVGGVATIADATGEVTYAGIGNTEARVLGQSHGRLFSRDGLLGGPRTPRPERQTIRLMAGHTFLMHTDGVQLPDAWRTPDVWPCDRVADDALGHARPQDDASVVVARWRVQP